MKRTAFKQAAWIVGVIAGIAFAARPEAQEAQRLLEDYGTTITVYGDRIPAAQRQILDAPATVAVLTREEIQASGARTVQEALAQLPSVTLHNQTGNPVESTVDVRGFPQGTSLAVFLDGVRLNDLQDNSVRWDVIPIEDVERIEVYRGATGPLYGGGALAGVVNIVTRRDPGIPRLDLKAGAGSFDGREARLHTSGTLRQWEWYAAAMHRASRGWRENDGYSLDDALLRGAWSPDETQLLAFSYKYSGGSESDPGALTEEEMRKDPRQSPYNRYDGTRGRHRVASLTYTGSPSPGLSFSAQAFTRLNDRDTLTTGRFGSGFLSKDAERLSGLTLQAHAQGKSGSSTWQVDAGTEASSGRLDARGYFTDPQGGSQAPASRTSTGQRLEGAYVQGDLGLGAFHLFAGGRTDRNRYDYEDRLLPANDTRRTFRESTWRAGALQHFGEWSSAYAAFSEGYRIPTVAELFAYPGYYSNPNLVPARARDWELGWRYLQGGWRFKVSLFRMEVRNEVVYVLTDPLHFIGQNQNVGASLRKGIEADGHLPLPGGFSLFGAGSYQDTEVTDGPYAGSRVPMVPRYQASLGVQWSNPGWTARFSASWVGSQRLDSDLENRRPSLPGYATVDLSARYAFRALTVEASVTNLLDRSYAGRGITNGYQDFFTPAYPRSFRCALTWSF
jgi:iron complex outermembrane receptor protein